MQFRGYHINNLKSYRKYFCFLDAVDALENGAYGEWLAALSEIMKEKEAAVSEDARIIEEIRLLLEQCYKGGNEDTKRSEESYRKLFLLFYKLAHLPVTDGDIEEINRLACFEAEKRKKGQACGGERTDAGLEIILTGKEYRFPVWRREEDHQLFVWKKLVNRGSFPVSVRIVNEEWVKGHAEGCKEEYGEEYKEEFRCLNPGGFAWVLTRNNGFVRWGRRVQVDHRSFACVDRKGCLTVDGYPMQGSGMVDFSFDRQTGILGVDRDGGLRQYSRLELEGKAGSEGKLAFACLKGKIYILAGEDGTFVTNLTDHAEDLTEVFNRQVTRENLCQEKAFFREMFFWQDSAAKELPFQAAVISVSDQLIGFEAPDSRVGVWDREQERMIWMEGTE